jgi:hypothetical protein
MIFLPGATGCKEQEVIEQTLISANGVSAYVRSGHVSCFPPPQLSDIEDLEATSV